MYVGTFQTFLTANFSGLRKTIHTNIIRTLTKNIYIILFLTQAQYHVILHTNTSYIHSQPVAHYNKKTDNTHPQNTFIPIKLFIIIRKKNL